MGFFDWLKRIFAPDEYSGPEKRRRSREDEEEEEIEELIAIDII